MLDRLLSPATEDEELLVKGRTLNLLSLVTALIIVLYYAITTLTTPGQISAGATIALGIGFLLSVGCYWLGRRGRVRLAAYLLFIGLFAAISFYATDPGNKLSDLGMVPMLYLLVALPAGFVNHPRTSVLVTTLGALFFGIYLGLAPPAAYAGYEDKPSFLSNVGLAFALSYILSAVAWVFSQGIGQTLGRVQEQNRELAAFAQELEAQRQLRADTGKQILELAERLAQYSSRQARGANRQAAAVAQVSTSIEELTQAAREIAQNAHLVDRAAQQTLQGAREGQEVVERNSEAMDQIQAHARRGVEEATGLDEHLKQVNRVATIISDVASQIQLVAFNATLEAAEAGEAGQRFGVVAGEVKDLAADSLRQAKQVAQIVRQVGEAGEAVVSLSEEQVQAVRSGSDVMARSRAANQAIIDSASRMAELAGQIQQTTAQQQQANEQVADSVQEIRTVVDRWVVSSYQMDELVATLQSLAGQLA